MRKQKKRWLRRAGVCLGIVTSVVGLPGTLEDLARWQEWLAMWSDWRTYEIIAFIVGTVGLLAIGIVYAVEWWRDRKPKDVPVTGSVTLYAHDSLVIHHYKPPLWRRGLNRARRILDVVRARITP